MELKNQVGQHGNYVITEEINCYLVWYLVFGYHVNKAFHFDDASSRDAAFHCAKLHAEEQHKQNP